MILLIYNIQYVVSSTTKTSKVTSIELPNNKIVHVASPPYNDGENTYDGQQCIQERGKTITR